MPARSARLGPGTSRAPQAEIANLQSLKDKLSAAEDTYWANQVASTRSTSVATVLSPQSKRSRPSTHKSPGSATGAREAPAHRRDRSDLGSSRRTLQGCYEL